MNKFYLSAFAILATVLAVSALPLEDDKCTVTAYEDVKEATKSCDEKLVINIKTVPACKKLELDLQPNTHVLFKGHITFEHCSDKSFKGPLVLVKGKKVTISGGGAILDGSGDKYWDGKGGHDKPKFFRIQTTGGSKFNNIHLLNCPVQCVSIGAHDTTLNEWNIDNEAGDWDAKHLGHNTDGFDISSSSGITIENSIIKNQDDCVAINQGSNYHIRNLTCSGGHGLSLSVGMSKEDGTKNVVKDVIFSDCTVINSRNGIHVKTHCDGGHGSITNVTYRNIKLEGISHYGINVQENYKNGKTDKDAEGNIPIKQLIMKNVYGSMTGESCSMPVYIACGDGGCDSWEWSEIDIRQGKEKNSCNYKPNGFTC